MKHDATFRTHSTPTIALLKLNNTNIPDIPAAAAAAAEPVACDEEALERLEDRERVDGIAAGQEWDGHERPRRPCRAASAGRKEGRKAWGAPCPVDADTARPAASAACSPRAPASPVPRVGSLALPVAAAWSTTPAEPRSASPYSSCNISSRLLKGIFQAFERYVFSSILSNRR